LDLQSIIYELPSGSFFYLNKWYYLHIVGFLLKLSYQSVSICLEVEMKGDKMRKLALLMMSALLLVSCGGEEKKEVIDTFNTEVGQSSKFDLGLESLTDTDYQVTLKEATLKKFKTIGDFAIVGKAYDLSLEGFDSGVLSLTLPVEGQLAGDALVIVFPNKSSDEYIVYEGKYDSESKTIQTKIKHLGVVAVYTANDFRLRSQTHGVIPSNEVLTFDEIPESILVKSYDSKDTLGQWAMMDDPLSSDKGKVLGLSLDQFGKQAMEFVVDRPDALEKLTIGFDLNSSIESDKVNLCLQARVTSDEAWNTIQINGQDFLPVTDGLWQQMKIDLTKGGGNIENFKKHLASNGLIKEIQFRFVLESNQDEDDVSLSSVYLDNLHLNFNGVLSSYDSVERPLIESDIELTYLDPREVIMGLSQISRESIESQSSLFDLEDEGNQLVFAYGDYKVVYSSDAQQKPEYVEYNGTRPYGSYSLSKTAKENLDGLVEDGYTYIGIARPDESHHYIYKNDENMIAVLATSTHVTSPTLSLRCYSLESESNLNSQLYSIVEDTSELYATLKILFSCSEDEVGGGIVKIQHVAQYENSKGYLTEEYLFHIQYDNGTPEYPSSITYNGRDYFDVFHKDMTKVEVVAIMRNKGYKDEVEYFNGQNHAIFFSRGTSYVTIEFETEDDDALIGDMIIPSLDALKVN